MYSRDLKNCQKHPCFYKKRIEGFTVEITIPVMLASSYDVRKERFFPGTKNYIHLTLLSQFIAVINSRVWFYVTKLSPAAALKDSSLLRLWWRQR